MVLALTHHLLPITSYLDPYRTAERINFAKRQPEAASRSGNRNGNQKRQKAGMVRGPLLRTEGLRPGAGQSWSAVSPGCTRHGGLREDGGPGLETSGVTRTEDGGRKTEGGERKKEDGVGKPEDPLERGAETGTKKVTKSTKERSGSGVKNTKDTSERNSTDSGFERLGVRTRYSYSFVKEFHWLTVIPVNTGQMQWLIAQQTDLIHSFGLDSPQ